MLKPVQERSMHNLINQPGGVCMDTMACGFDECNPLNPETYPDITVEETIHSLVDNMDSVIGDTYLSAMPVANLPKNQSLVDAWLEADNPAWNLPSTVLFPVTAGDIVTAINFAKTHGLEVSVKNSGHSYTGASMKKDTLHINMNNYRMYAANGIVDCNETADEDAPFQSDLSDQACRFAKARGKNGIIRVGGGENFDKMYRAVKSFNENHKNETGSYKYYNAGGGAGTVSPMGWTFQGGLATTTNGRSIGFGVDQVIQVDMVLPNGEHVRFGPTQWEDQDDNFIYPSTTEVTGVCLQNPEEDESKWAWSTCEEDIPFDDLWFALRGGGGGTWGIVTSMIINLHDYLPLEFGGSSLLWCIPSGATPIYKPYFARFFMALFSNPSSIGVTDEEASRCSAFGLGDSPDGNQLFCYGASSSKPFLSAWSVYVSGLNKTLADAGLNTSTINDLASSCGHEVGIPQVDFPSMAIFQDGPNKGKVSDNHPPAYLPVTENHVNMIVPAKYVADNPNASDAFDHLFYGAFGANVPYATDQANALSEAHRLGGFMAVLTHDSLDESFYTDIFPQMFDTTDPSNFPSFVGSNHAGPNTRGPLKEDWTKPCPLNWTTAERDDKCISLQEAIWGTKLLRRLEKIKEEIDPNYMFDCYGCVGNNRFRAEGFSVDPNTTGNVGRATEQPRPPGLSEVQPHHHIVDTDPVHFMQFPAERVEL